MNKKRLIQIITVCVLTVFVVLAQGCATTQEKEEPHFNAYEMSMLTQPPAEGETVIGTYEGSYDITNSSSMTPEVAATIISNVQGRVISIVYNAGWTKVHPKKEFDTSKAAFILLSKALAKAKNEFPDIDMNELGVRSIKETRSPTFDLSIDTNVNAVGNYYYTATNKYYFSGIVVRLPKNSPTTVATTEGVTVGKTPPTANTISTNLLFPLDGVTLGKTTEKELQALGKKISEKHFGDGYQYGSGKSYKGYEVNGFEVWYDDKPNLAFLYEFDRSVVTRQYDKLPNKWVSAGMSFDLSYDQWIDWAKKNNLSVWVKVNPNVSETSSGVHFDAVLVLSYIADGVKYEIELRFFGEKNTSKTSDKETTSHIWVRGKPVK